MNPLFIGHQFYTEYGYKNFINWLEIGGFDNITWKPNGSVIIAHRLSIENHYILFKLLFLDKKIWLKIAANWVVSIYLFGENEAIWKPIADNSTSLRDNLFSIEALRKCTLLE